jgi:hypothetical protein
MTAVLLRRAATLLRNPYLCNWDHAVAHALAAAMDEVAKAVRLSRDFESRLGYSELIATARALLLSFGHTCGDSDSPCRSCALTVPAEDGA